MNILQIDPKYHVEIDDCSTELNPRIVKTSNGEAIPENEPVILFRARDKFALAMLGYYLGLCEKDNCADYQMQSTIKRINAFEQFANKNKDKMKQPGITKGL